ncbi:MAG: hypothetical protein B6244_09655 [Candidatus Cloacimonetes bacterium 4572_55]|nr:MAG: hypothetical protein B6244_09655 [Candidatus Cloacimonetes bacterium 4572_55]
METFLDYIKYKPFGFDLEIYKIILPILIVLLSLITRKLFDRYISRLLTRWAKKTRFKYDDLFVQAIQAPISALFLSVGLYFAIAILNFDSINKMLSKGYTVALSLIAIWTLYRMMDLVTELIHPLFADDEEEEIMQQFSPLIRQSLRVTVVIIGGIMIIQNQGVEVGSLLTGLGIGGIAIALAAQDSISNLFGTFVMFTDRPFRVGDWIEFQGVDGDVEQIGLRSTRVRTWAKSQVTIPNKLFSSGIIENWSAMPKRRVKMIIGLTYQTRPEEMKAFVNRVRELLRSDERVNQDFLLVNFTEFGHSSLDILIYYFTKTTRWAEYLDIRQQINLRIMEIVEEMGLSFAFPTQTLHFAKSLEKETNLLGESGSIGSDARADIRSDLSNG